MKYILLHNLDDLLKEKTLEGYLKEGYIIAYKSEEDIIIKDNEDTIIDEDKYIKIAFSIINKSTVFKKISKIVDLSDAFKYAQTKGKYNMFNNKFDWHIRQLVTKNII